jgi:hypothetical protein
MAITIGLSHLCEHNGATEDGCAGSDCRESRRNPPLPVRGYQTYVPVARAIALALAGTLIAMAAVFVTAQASSAVPASRGLVHVYSIGTATSQAQTVVLTGAIGDAGTLTVTGPTDTVNLSKGTLVVDLSKGSAAENKIFNHLSTFVSPASCSMNSSYTAPVKILSGTGAYAGATGTLVVRTSDVGVFPRTASGACNLSSNAQPVGFLSIGQGSGFVHLA